jgi:hypothetical protein
MNCRERDASIIFHVHHALRHYNANHEVRHRSQAYPHLGHIDFSNHTNRKHVYYLEYFRVWTLCLSSLWWLRTQASEATFGPTSASSLAGVANPLRTSSLSYATTTTLAHQLLKHAPSSVSDRLNHEETSIITFPATFMVFLQDLPRWWVTMLIFWYIFESSF